MQNMKNITYYHLDKEIQKLATKCTKVKSNTARQKASNFLNEYRFNIISTEHKKSLLNIDRAFKILKEGKFEFTNLKENLKLETRVVFLKNIVSYSYSFEENKLQINLTNGKEEIFGGDFYEILKLVL